MMPLFSQVNVSYQFQDTILIFKNRAMNTSENVMKIKIIKLWELIKFFIAEKRVIAFSTQDIGVIFRGCLWKCSPLSGISFSNIKKQFLQARFFFLAEVKWNIEIVLQNIQKINILLPLYLWDSHPKSFIDLKPRSNLMVLNQSTTKTTEQ